MENTDVAGIPAIRKNCVNPFFPKTRLVSAASRFKTESDGMVGRRNGPGFGWRGGFQVTAIAKRRLSFEGATTL